MKKQLIHLHSIITPLIFFPVAYGLWLHYYHGSHLRTLLTFLFPVCYAYVIPYIGICRLKLWEFRSHLNVKKMRPQSGFIFGSAAAFFAFLCVINKTPTFSFMSLLKSGFLTASVFGFWNWIFEIYAMKKGAIVVFSKKYREGKDPEVVSMDYAPVNFGLNGFCLGLIIYGNQYIMFDRIPLLFSILVIVVELLCYLVIPILGVVAYNLKVNGETGLKPYGSLNA
ncbi:MAG: hypothetical protein ACXVCY_07800 [Pseudobdellovibrionaceae bacterium]